MSSLHSTLLIISGVLFSIFIVLMAITPLDRTINNQSPTFLFLFSAIVVAAATLTLTGNPLGKGENDDSDKKDSSKRISRSKKRRMDKIKELKAVGQAADEKWPKRNTRSNQFRRHRRHRRHLRESSKKIVKFPGLTLEKKFYNKMRTKVIVKAKIKAGL